MQQEIKTIYEEFGEQLEAEKPASIKPAEGGVTAAPGFKAAGVHAGFRDDPERLDFALIVADKPCAAAATFTQNVFCAAPVSASKAHLNGEQHGTAQAIIINSGCANAATGKVGLETAEASAQIAAAEIGCKAEEVLLASTGVIGEHLSLEPFKTGVPAALSSAASGKDAGHDAARAIMTTDTVPKEAAVTFTVEACECASASENDGAFSDAGVTKCDGATSKNGATEFDATTFATSATSNDSAPEYASKTYTVGGMAKGSGMIMPNMATMISIITTDAPVEGEPLRAALKSAVDNSFNKITVDSDTSTNDTCIILANPACAAETPEAPAAETPAATHAPALYAQFSAALQIVCENLARQMAADGEGATKLITVRVFNAATSKDADAAARTIANSPLVKTAIFGHDCNWGRIAAAAGRSGVAFNQESVDIDIMGLPVCRGGLTVSFSEEEALKRFENSEITIDVNLRAGHAHTRIWTCDLTHDYITINGDYRT